VTAIAGCDWAWGQPSDASLEAAGVLFVARYLSTADPSKCITRREADRHRAAGRGIVLVFENDARRMLAGHSGGVADATASAAQVRGLGLDGCPVYFAADWDALEGQQPMIDAYLGGAVSVLGLARTGIYGGYWPLTRARQAGKATYFWGTRAWSGDRWTARESAWAPHIMQGGATTIGGVSCDWDVANHEDYGQWKGGTAPPPPPGWQEAMMRGLPTLKAGGTGGDVRSVQGLLCARGHPVAIDGVFGPATTAAVRDLQRAAKIAVDSTVGPDTWQALHAA